MSKESERDQLTDRLLRQSFQRDALAAPAPTASCVDAETMAAWVDGGLTATVARQVETHLSECARCQAVLATFATTEPVAGVAPAVVPFWQRWSIRWVVPVAAGAAAVLVWTVSRPTAPLDQPSQTMARVEQAERLDEPAQAPPVPSAPEAGAPVDNSFREVASVPQGTGQAQQMAKSVVLPGEARLAPPVPAALAPLPPPAPLEARAAPTAERAFTARAEAPNLAGQQNRTMDSIGASAAPPAPSSSVERQRQATDVTVLAEFAVPLARAVAETQGVPAAPPPPPAALPSGVATAPSFAAPAGLVTRWRILTNGRVERATANGPTWEPVVVEPGASLTNGAATSPLVCWLVGRAGVILRTTDGRTFARVPFPSSLDVVFVSAVNALEARVTTADGRVWATTDGGRTWQ